MSKDKISAFYDVAPAILASAMQYIGGFFGVAALAANLADLYQHSKKINAGNLIDGSNNLVAIVGGLIFVAGSVMKHYVNRDASVNEQRIEEAVNSALESNRMKISRTLEEQRAYTNAYAKAMEATLKQIKSNNDYSGLEESIK